MDRNNSYIILIIAIVTAVVLIWWWNFGYTPRTKEIPSPTPTVTQQQGTPTIEQELNDLNLEDLNSEFESIDQDLNSL